HDPKDFCGQDILVVGGGAVASRKVKTMLACGAGRVTVVSPDFHVAMPTTGITRIAEMFRVEHLSKARLAVVATDRTDVNEVVQRVCDERGILCLRLDNAPAGDGILPAVIREGPIVASVATGDPGTTRKVAPAIRAAVTPYKHEVRRAAKARRAKLGRD
ncbi:MAG: NAD(P)-dependent oxidoreductase, partial [Planctomycetota bacterium]